MRRIVPILALAILPAIAVAGDKQGKTELQQDICWQWEKAHGAPFNREVEETSVSYARHAIDKGGFTKYDYTLDRKPPFDRLQQLCERYFDRYGQWAEECCGVAPLTRGTVGEEAKEQGRIDRAKRWDHAQNSAQP